jgi:hypothetical protein
MRAPENATMLCRVLLGLDRSEATGTLALCGEGRSATLSLENGSVTGANVDRRVASSRRQLLEGAVAVCRWGELTLRFEGAPATTTWWKLREPVRARVLSLECMRASVVSVDTADVRADLGRGVYRLTELGDHLLRGAELRPDETSTMFWLRRGVAAEEVLSLPGCGVRGYRFLWLLKLLRGAAPRSSGSYPLLLRKRRELRNQASAHALLDLPTDAADGDARRALRKLVRDLHPDRFGDDVPAPLRRASAEIVTALVDAESKLGTGH